MSLSRLLSCVTLLVLASAGIGCSSVYPSTVGRDVWGVNNFDQFDEAPPRSMYRGAQPTREGLATLRDKYGVRTVIDLRGDREAWEEAAVREAGMRYVNIPCFASESARDMDRHVREFLAAVRRSEGPIFVHCRQGRDRTGLAVASYELVTGKRKAGEAIREMEAHGHFKTFFPGIEAFIRDMKVEEYRPILADADVPPRG